MFCPTSTFPVSTFTWHRPQCAATSSHLSATRGCQRSGQTPAPQRDVRQANQQAAAEYFRKSRRSSSKFLDLEGRLSRPAHNRGIGNPEASSATSSSGSPAHASSPQGCADRSRTGTHFRSSPPQSHRAWACVCHSAVKCIHDHAEVQYPHCSAPSSRKACCTGLSLPSTSSPSIVTIFARQPNLRAPSTTGSPARQPSPYRRRTDLRRIRILSRLDSADCAGPKAGFSSSGAFTWS